MWRLVLLASGLAVWSLATGCDSRPPSRKPLPNVVLITLDTTRADHLSCYGYQRRTTPNIDRLAAEGVLFSDAMTQAAVTPVSHASILTGQYPYTHGLRVMHGRDANRLPESQVTLAELLKKLGYHTGAFVSAFPVSRRFGLDQGFDVFDQDFIVDPENLIVAPDGVVNTGSNQRRADHTTDRALRWLEGVARPFFLWVHYFDPHDPKVLPPPAYLRQHARGGETTADQLRDIYDVELQFTDEQIGRLFNYLEQRGLLSNTIVVITADHGEGLGDHNWWTHGILYQEQIHAPLILAGPGLPRGKRVSSLVRTVDIVPTILDLVGVRTRPLPKFDGVSLKPLIQQAGGDLHLSGYADSLNILTYRTAVGKDDVKDDVLFVLRRGRWKYIHHLRRPAASELYDLSSDPHESHNLYQSNPQIAEKLFAEIRARGAIPQRIPGGEPMDRRDLERLKRLGYILNGPAATRPAP